jgi:hypothetical protein
MRRDKLYWRLIIFINIMFSNIVVASKINTMPYVTLINFLGDCPSHNYITHRPATC